MTFRAQTADKEGHICLWDSGGQDKTKTEGRRVREYEVVIYTVVGKTSVFASLVSVRENFPNNIKTYCLLIDWVSCYLKNFSTSF